MTTDAYRTALAFTMAVAETIRELGEVPSGHLYARLMDRLSLASYDAIITSLKNAKLVEEKSHVLRWVGPTLLGQQPES